MLNIAGQYCTLYGNPSNESIQKNMFSRLTEQHCVIDVLYPDPLKPNASSNKKGPITSSVAYTIIFACTGFVLLIITIIIITILWRRYRRMLSDSYNNFDDGL